ncbi:hypothetical protein RF11_06456 [Thelohanellus kitauei]|uniref:Uncharacterized protein n=1 Tax=Thelohanellus kitauei TaxID=669202 RepID=A0A0C2J494_THEKT|nr:hypothetical protein RF11_06456 [Thelohanellus kitauei]
MINNQYSEASFKIIWSKIYGNPKPILGTFLEIDREENTATISVAWSRINLVAKNEIDEETVTKINLTTGQIIDNQIKSTQTWSYDRSLLAKVFKDISELKKTYHIEGTLKQKISLSDKTIHEELESKYWVTYLDFSYASLAWSPECTKLYYLAEISKKDRRPFNPVTNFQGGRSEVYKPQICCVEISEGKISKAFDFPPHLYPYKVLPIKIFLDLFMKNLEENCWLNHQDSPGVSFSVGSGIKNEWSTTITNYYLLSRIEAINPHSFVCAQNQAS